MRAKFLTLRFKHLIVLFLVTLTFLVVFHISHYPNSSNINATISKSPSSTSLDNILFCVASCSSSLSRRLPYLRLWHTPNKTRVAVFLDKPHPHNHGFLFKTVVSEPTSRFPYTFPRWHRSAIRIARMVKEALRLDVAAGVKWFVFGDDDTVFFPENVERALAKYDGDGEREWYYVGSRSESVEQNVRMSFEMGYGGGGFAISAALAEVLGRVIDSCLFRCPHLYGSDSRVFSCLVELDVPVTLHPGFHQVIGVRSEEVVKVTATAAESKIKEDEQRNRLMDEVNSGVLYLKGDVRAVGEVALFERFARKTYGRLECDISIDLRSKHLLSFACS